MEDVLMMHLTLLEHLNSSIKHREKLLQESIYWEEGESKKEEMEEELDQVNEDIEKVKYYMQPFLN
tara:strand:- start:989 stop:1186 length:198 start_codon:yes stop_codon:yes gene_type:complete